MNSVAANQAEPGHDINIKLEYEIEEDVEAELEEFVRLNHKGQIKDANNLFDECLVDHVQWFPVAAEYADFLLRQGDFARLAKFCAITAVEFSDPHEKALLFLLQAIGDSVQLGSKTELKNAAKYTWHDLSLESFDDLIGSPELGSTKIHLLEVITQIEAYTGAALISEERDLGVAHTRRTNWLFVLLGSGHFWEAQRHLHCLFYDEDISFSESQRLLTAFLDEALRCGVQHEPIQVAVSALVQGYWQSLTSSGLGPLQPVDWNDEVTDALFNPSPKFADVHSFRRNLSPDLGWNFELPLGTHRPDRTYGRKETATPNVSDSLTVRMSNLPIETDVEGEDIRRFFDSRVGPPGKVILKHGIGNVVLQAKKQTKQTTVTLSSLELKEKALETCHEAPFSAKRGGEKVMVDVDDKFMGLTTLFMPASGEPNIDIVAVHGLSGNAWTTFASVQSTRQGIEEVIWLRDWLPRYLEGRKKVIRPRVMTFGYHAEIWINNAVEDLDTPVSDLIRSLEEHREDAKRPLILIGHSLGGIVVKQVVYKMMMAEQQIDPHYVTPIKACVFLAVPHRDTGQDGSLRTFLARLKDLSVQGTGQSKNTIQHLELRNEKIIDITDVFIRVLRGSGIQVLSCYEEKSYAPGEVKVVDTQSSLLPDPSHNRYSFAIDATHSDCARFGNTRDSPFYAIASRLAEISKEAVDSIPGPLISVPIINRPKGYAYTSSMIAYSAQARARAEPGSRDVESEFYYLADYGTVFLVDDSASMSRVSEAGISLWDDTTHAISECAKLILGARGKLNVHFLNSEERSKDHITSIPELLDSCQFIPAGYDAPIFERLEDHLRKFVRDFRAYDDPDREAFPGLNLIIFTDGAPDDLPGDEDPEYLIHGVVKDLRESGAYTHKLGIHFVQIGEDKSGTQFFDQIEKNLKRKRVSPVATIDVTRYDRVKADERVYRKIALGARSGPLDSVKRPIE